MTKNQANLLAGALKKRFPGKAEFEPVNAQGRYRFAIVSGRFNAMSQLERQDEVWKVVDRVLPRAATLDISTILAFAPADMATAK